MSNSTEAPAGKNYAIMRVERIAELGEMRRVEQHNTRQKLSENVELGGPAPRELIADGPPDVVDRAHLRMAECGLVLDKVAGAVGVEVVLTTSHAWWQTATDQMQQGWIEANLDWLSKKFGRALLSAKLHEDEKTPHIHAVALAAVCKVDGVRGPKPKTEEGRARRRAEEATRKPRWRWNYRDLFGGDFEQLSLEQDRYHAAVAHLGLHRGERAQEVPDLKMDSGVVVPSERLSRGKRRDGSHRPRRRITTKQYQAMTREEYVVAKKQRELADEDRASAESARLAAEANVAATDAARVKIEMLKNAAERDRRAAAAERSAVEALKRQQEERIAFFERDVAEIRAAAAADRAAVERLRIELAAAAAAAKVNEERAAADARAQAMARRDAEKERAAAAEDRNAAAASRQRIEQQIEAHEAQLALLARAADDENGLDLRVSGTTFAMNVQRMTADERAAHKSSWPPMLVHAAQAFATALERLRLIAHRLAKREKAVAALEAVLDNRASKLEQDAAANEAQAALHREAILDLDRRRSAVQANERQAEAAMAAASARLAAAQSMNARADAVLSVHNRWVIAMAALEPDPDWVEVEVEVEGLQRIRLDPNVARASPPELVATLREPAPAWAISLALKRKELAEALRRADEREHQADYLTAQLTDMIEEAGPVLTPVQRNIVKKATRTAQQVAAAKEQMGR